MDRFVHGAAATGFVCRAERGRGQHSERAGQHRGDIRQHVTKQVVGDDDVELLRRAHKLHRAVIGQHVAEIGIGVFIFADPGCFLAPEHTGFHYVVLFDRAHSIAALLGKIERDTADTADFLGRVDLRVHAAALAICQGLDAAGLAEIDATGQFADEQDIEPGDKFALQAGRIGKRIEADRGTQVSEQVHVLAQPQQAGFRAHVIADIIPLRTADSTEQHGIGINRNVHGFVGNRFAMRFVGRTADQVFGDVKRYRTALVHPVDQTADL